jgi:hypothetical protein
MRENVAQTGRKATHSSLEGVTVGVRRSRAPPVGNPRLEAEERPR